MRDLIIPSRAIALRGSRELTPAMLAVVWEIASEIAEQRHTLEIDEKGVWLEMASARLRGDGARSDNVWLRECLDRLTGLRMTSEYRGEPWGGVILSQWHLAENGSLAHLLITPAGIEVLHAPETFARLEAQTAHRLSGHARQLYAILADKKRLDRPWWIFQLEELRSLMGVDQRESYAVWQQFKRWVLRPAIDEINEYSTVHVEMEGLRRGRSIVAVRLSWHWKDPFAAAETVAKNERARETKGPKQTDQVSRASARAEAWDQTRARLHERYGDVVARLGWRWVVLTDRGPEGVTIQVPSTCWADWVQQDCGDAVREIWRTIEPDTVIDITKMSDEIEVAEAKKWWKSADMVTRGGLAAHLGYTRRSADAPDLTDESGLALPAWHKLQQRLAADTASD